KTPVPMTFIPLFMSLGEWFEVAFNPASRSRDKRRRQNPIVCTVCTRSAPKWGFSAKTAVFEESAETLYSWWFQVTLRSLKVVLGGGLEPPCLAAYAPQTYVSAISPPEHLFHPFWSGPIVLPRDFFRARAFF